MSAERGDADGAEPLTALADRLAAVVAALYPDAAAEVRLGEPPDPAMGDVSTNVAFALAKAARDAPGRISARIARAARDDGAVMEAADGVEAVGGFVNLRMRPAFWLRYVADAIREGEAYGRGSERGVRVSLEFGSANPTGPLLVVQGRALSVGDTLARAMRHAGYSVVTEWVVNDAGGQMEALGGSVYARYRQIADPCFPDPAGGYPGGYLVPIAEALRRSDGGRWDADPVRGARAFALAARDAIVEGQRRDAARFGVTFDLWQSERDLHADGRVAAAVAKLVADGWAYERDGSTLLRTTRVGDAEDRVLVRRDGSPAYLAADAAYHAEKLARADVVIDILGPDHHGYIKRLDAVAHAAGRPGAIEVVIAQQVTIRQGGRTVPVSKRGGAILTLADVLDEIGVDAARFFFAMLSTDQPLAFDLKLAARRTRENPVFYVQYGHARIASVLRQAASSHPSALDVARRGGCLDLLADGAEMALARRIAALGRLVADIARTRRTHLLPAYARALAADFHRFYDGSPILGADRDLAAARLGLCLAARTALATALRLCGVSTPDSM